MRTVQLICFKPRIESAAESVIGNNGISHKELIDLFVNKARLALNDGEMFGPGGEGFMRLNVGCPRSVLKEALDRLIICN